MGARLRVVVIASSLAVLCGCTTVRVVEERSAGDVVYVWTRGLYPEAESERDAQVAASARCAAGKAAVLSHTEKTGGFSRINVYRCR